MAIASSPRTVCPPYLDTESMPRSSRGAITSARSGAWRRWTLAEEHGPHERGGRDPADTGDRDQANVLREQRPDDPHELEDRERDRGGDDPAGPALEVCGATTETREWERGQTEARGVD